jgi:V/A-type H+-transporting ATPase subunit G/H
MDEKRIDQVLEIENQAKGVHESALREAERMIIQAEKDAQGLIEKAKAEAEQEAKRIVSYAQKEDEHNRILTDAEKDAREMEGVAMVHFDRAVSYVLNRVIEREKA